MAVLNDTESPVFQEWVDRHRWFPVVREHEYGERDEEPTIPAPLNWLEQLPPLLYFAFSDCECTLVYVRSDGQYGATLWDVTGEDDLPWAVFLVDDYGPRLLSEYSVLDEDAETTALDALLLRASEELPDRLEAGVYDRIGTPAVIPAFLDVPPLEVSSDMQAA